MRLSRIQISNFRNFRELDISLGSHAVIVGENKIGKSNLLFALRLLLDPTLPESARQLRLDDFWDGLRPVAKNGQRALLPKGTEIRVAIEIADFEDDASQLAMLAEHMIEAEPMVARLTYVCRAKGEVEGAPVKDDELEFFVFGGDNEDNSFGYEVRKRLPLDVLPALRDAESDLANWRRSPLRPLLENAASGIPAKDLVALAQQISAAANAVSGLPQLQQLETEINDRLNEMVGSTHATDVKLSVAATGADKLVRALRPFIDGGRRGVGEASLGSANLIYLSLKSLELQHLVVDKARDHTFLGIEEPEAHLHPHLQRLIYKDFLKARGEDEEDPASGTSIILTTHSPHIVSVAPLRSLVLLKRAGDGSTVGASTADLALDDKDVADLERYLDVTRGEILFSRGVLLVEGDAEAFLVPAFARLNGYDLDVLGITVCSVAGTNFLPYVLLLGPKGLDIPFAVVTDYDPMPDEENLGLPRIVKLLEEGFEDVEVPEDDEDEQRETGKAHGLFVGDHTLEVDLFDCDQEDAVCDTLVELSENGEARKRAKGWKADPGTLDAKQFLKDIGPIGKGRFAQRLASNLTAKDCPEYVLAALKHVADQCE